MRAFAARGFSRLIGRSPRAFRIARRLGWITPEERVRWLGARTVGEASRALATNAGRLLRPPRTAILMIGQDGPIGRSLERQFQRRGHPHHWLRSRLAPSSTVPDPETLACVVLAETKTADITRAARDVLDDPRLSALPLEYATGLEPEHRQFRRQDEYSGEIFISPALLADPSPYELYAQSLERFEQKCGLRDYLDLYQLLVSVHERQIPGEIAEFGSYKGHSGWLIGRTLDALGSSRGVHLFDMFDSFPQESAGIDRFWSGTHEVNLAEVRAKLTELPRVRLVPGEFERTLPSSGLEEVALAYVDCDSYRAVSYVAREVFEDRLSPGGVIVFEDYGHPALLGCRVAVHEYFDGRSDCVRFFSQFSGLYVVIKDRT